MAVYKGFDLVVSSSTKGKKFNFPSAAAEQAAIQRVENGLKGVIDRLYGTEFGKYVIAIARSHHGDENGILDLHVRFASNPKDTFGAHAVSARSHDFISFGNGRDYEYRDIGQTPVSGEEILTGRQFLNLWTGAYERGGGVFLSLITIKWITFI